MKRNQRFFRVDRFGLVLGAALLGTLAGCIGYEQREGQLEARDGSPDVQATFAVEDDYVYYPNYECYYSVSRQQYAYREGNAWVARSAPRGVSADVVRGSPSVRMDFHDSPAQHHTTVAKQYPKNWKPSVEKRAQKEDRNGGQPDQH
jgi:hypothetical protein